MSAYANLRHRRQLFVDYLVELNVGSKAAAQAFPDSKRPDVIASKLLANPEVKAAVIERRGEVLAELGVNVVRALREVTNIAFFNPKHMHGPDGKVLPLHMIDDSVVSALSSVTCDTQGRPIKYRVHAKTESLKLILQYLNVLVERHEVTGENGGPIKTQEISPLDKARRIAFLLDAGIRAKASTPISIVEVTDDDEESETPGAGG